MEELESGENKKRKLRFIDFDERISIEKMIKDGLSIRQIAIALNRSATPVRHEILRCGYIKNYNAESAHKNVAEVKRKKNEKAKFKITEEKKNQIHEWYKEGRSLAFISSESEISLSIVKKITNHERVDTHERLTALEEQIKILTDMIKEIYAKNI